MISFLNDYLSILCIVFETTVRKYLTKYENHHYKTESDTVVLSISLYNILWNVYCLFKPNHLHVHKRRNVILFEICKKKID